MSIMNAPKMTVEMRIEITDNWYAIRIQATGKVLAVGTWLPPECDGIVAELLDPREAKRLLAVLANRAENPKPEFVGVAG